ncbi:uncharacterized protein AB675_4092 [Cyphellophora attinorum]|uniref:BHLH domain-containing protein n=1 Tax=Cyphellophora attinorum TaxID=1664694 RepID=A0A0N0NL63_9EURO|nr:uncharacterized protein AB675_4092 [Phialophora attinorum]KPI38669.1 hypothetical protein AB675_4092 [Phialophora attinorum]
MGDYGQSQQAYFYGAGLLNDPAQYEAEERTLAANTAAGLPNGMRWSSGRLDHNINNQSNMAASGLLNPYSIAPASMPYAYGSTATGTYTQQWSGTANTFEQNAVPQPEHGDPRMHLDREEIGRGLPQTSRRRDSRDSQWSQITTNDSATSSMPEHTVTPRSHPKTKSKPRMASPDMPSTHKKHKTWSTRPHSIIEKKYRENLNNKILQLHDALLETKRLPMLRRGDQASARISKQEIIANAIKYVNEMELNARHMDEQIELNSQLIERLTKKIEDLEGGT